jgi:hypothetical protein
MIQPVLLAFFFVKNLDIFLANALRLLLFAKLATALHQEYEKNKTQKQYQPAQKRHDISE